MRRLFENSEFYRFKKRIVSVKNWVFNSISTRGGGDYAHPLAMPNLNFCHDYAPAFDEINYLGHDRFLATSHHSFVLIPFLGTRQKVPKAIFALIKYNKN